MKKIIKIKTKSKNYQIIVQRKSILAFINNERKNNNKKFVIIDSSLSGLINNLKTNKSLKIIKIKGGEKIKSYENYLKLTSKLLKYKIDRSSTIIAIGGGTIGDISGFIASTILRGVNFVLIPTTLLSQVDSSIGGKNGINTIYGKNLLGTFYQPDKVIIDPIILNSLSKREIKSGYAEILKHAIIKDFKFYCWLEENHKDIIDLKPKIIDRAIVESIKIKAHFVKKDEKENLLNNSSRALLNFGHTFGHALETLSKYRKNITHGEAISIGMAIEAKISLNKNLINKNDYERIISHLIKVKLPYATEMTKRKKIYEIISLDKKNSNNKINLILLKGIGKAFYCRGLKITDVNKLIR